MLICLYSEDHLLYLMSLAYKNIWTLLQNIFYLFKYTHCLK